MVVSTTIVSSTDLPASLGAVKIAVNEQVPPAVILEPVHLFGSVIAKYWPVVTLMLLIVNASDPAVSVTVALLTPSGSTLPKSTSSGSKYGGITPSISLTDTARVMPSRVIGPVPVRW